MRRIILRNSYLRNLKTNKVVQLEDRTKTAVKLIICSFTRKISKKRLKRIPKEIQTWKKLKIKRKMNFLS